MKKVGIITHYYNSQNYGGVLQAYALCRVLNKEGYAAEQICYNSNQNTRKSSKKTARIIFLIKNFTRILLTKVWKKHHYKDLVLRVKAFEKFRDDIPHSKDVYNDFNIDACLMDYDYFITGSDQVWHPKNYRAPYFLTFVKDKPKISYAASLSVNQLSDFELDRIKSNVEDFMAISVREENAVSLINNVTQLKVHHVVDPVLLLDKTEWDSICANRMISDRYVFCYFLGKDNNYKRSIIEFARKNSLKIVTLPGMNGKCGYHDMKFADINLFDVTPPQFLSLIKYSDAIFTDSYHATVFANIFANNFFTFCRTDYSEMSSRLHNLVNLFDCKENLCDEDFKICSKYYTLIIAKKSSVYLNSKLDTQRQNSLSFLKSALL